MIVPFPTPLGPHMINGCIVFGSIRCDDDEEDDDERMISPKDDDLLLLDGGVRTCNVEVVIPDDTDRYEHKKDASAGVKDDTADLLANINMIKVMTEMVDTNDDKEDNC